MAADRVTDLPPPRTTRRRWPWVTGGIVVVLAIVAAALTLVFQFGLPWWSGEGDRLHVHEAADGTHTHYQVHLPPQHTDDDALPVMIALHGCGMTGFGWNSMKTTTQFNALADREGFIVVYPSQRALQSPINCWNSADPRNQIRGAGEAAAIAGIAGEVIDTYGADPARVHVSGASSGAGTAVILAVTYPDVFATATTVAGGEYALNQVDPREPDAVPATATARQAWAQMGEHARQVPVLIVQGGSDDIVPTLVGERLVEQWTAIDDLVDDDLLNGSLVLSTESVEHPADDGRHAWTQTTHVAGDGRVLIEHVVVPDMGHAWSGPEGDGTYTDHAGPDASALAWTFAERHDAWASASASPE